MSNQSSLASADVVVVGAGSAGATAAIAAARSGARTLLIERYGFLGGTSTAVLDTFYGFYTPGSIERKVVGGIPDDVLSRLLTLGGILKRPNTYGAGTGVTYHPDYLKVAWDQLVKEAGVSVILHAWVQDVVVTADRITSLICATKKGLQRIDGKIFIDASGDADICFYSGVPLELAGEHEPAQSLTTTFRMCNVNLSERQKLSKTDFHALMAEAAKEYGLPRKEGSDHATTVPSMMASNMTRVQSFGVRNGHIVNACDPHFLTQAEIEGRSQALAYIRFLRDKVAGYQQADLAAFGVQIGVRETRRILGQYRLTRQDVLSAEQFIDQIGLCGAPIEDHHAGEDTNWVYLPEGQCVGIPFRTLVPRKYENLLVAGRCFSATHDAQASVRSMAQCMAMGQAAGTAAALGIAAGVSISELNVAELQSRLRRAGAILETPHV